MYFIHACTYRLYNIYSKNMLCAARSHYAADRKSPRLDKTDVTGGDRQTPATHVVQPYTECYKM